MQFSDLVALSPCTPEKRQGMSDRDTPASGIVRAHSSTVAKLRGSRLQELLSFLSSKCQPGLLLSRG